MTLLYTAQTSALGIKILALNGMGNTWNNIIWSSKTFQTIYFKTDRDYNQIFFFGEGNG